MNLLIATFRTIFFYFYVIILYRIMGKREIGELGVIDLIVSMLIANIVAISVENLDHSILESVIPILILGILEISLAYLSIKSKKIRKLFDGKPTVIINNGKINHEAMIKERYNLDDLLINLRKQEIYNINEVKYAILEADGSLSIFKKKASINAYPLPLIIDTEINQESLNSLNKDINWLNNIIKKHHLNINNIFYAYYQNNKIHFILKKDLL